MLYINTHYLPIYTFFSLSFSHSKSLSLSLSWSPQIVHGLLLRFVQRQSISLRESVSSLEDIWYTVHEIFGLITSLWFRKLLFLPNVTKENCHSKKKYFREDTFATLLEQEQVFKACTDEDDISKLSLLYLAVFVLFGTQKHVIMDMRSILGTMLYSKTHEPLSRDLCDELLRKIGHPPLKGTTMTRKIRP